MPAQADTLIPVKPPLGSASANVSGINDSYAIAGSYEDQSGEHCFYGPANGTYTIFDVKGAAFCEPYSINNHGAIAGWSDKGAFTTDSKGKYHFVTKNGSPLNDGRANQINDSQNFVGYYTADDGLPHGYLGVGSQYKSDIDLGVSVGPVFAYGINNKGSIVGYAQFKFDGKYHAFLLVKGNVSLIDYPGPGVYDTRPFTINDSGLIGGIYSKGQKAFGFTYDSTSDTFRTIRVKKAKSAAVKGINNSNYATVNADTGPFILCPAKMPKCAVKD